MLGPLTSALFPLIASQSIQEDVPKDLYENDWEKMRLHLFSCNYKHLKCVPGGVGGWGFFGLS